MTRRKIYRIGSYTIETDRDNFILRKKSTVKDKESKNYGKESTAWTTYHANIRQAVDKILTEEERNNWGDIGLILSSHELVLSKLDELIKIQRS